MNNIPSFVSLVALKNKNSIISVYVYAVYSIILNINLLFGFNVLNESSINFH